MSDNKGKIRDRQKARAIRTKYKIRAAGDRPRLAVFRSAKHMYAQIIDDRMQKTLVSTSTLTSKFKDVDKKLTGIDAAKWVGKDIAQRATELGIKKVVFDRRSYRFHGKVKALADAARENGLEF